MISVKHLLSKMVSRYIGTGDFHISLSLVVYSKGLDVERLIRAGIQVNAGVYRGSFRSKLRALQ